MKASKYIKTMLILTAMVLPMFASAQEEMAVIKTSYFSNPLFNSLLTIIIILLAVLAVMAGVIKNILKNDLFRARIKEKAEKNKGKIYGAVIMLMLLTNVAYGQNAGTVAVTDWKIGGMEPYLFYMMVGVIFLEVILIYYFRMVIKGLLKPDEEAMIKAGIPPVKEKTIIEKLNASVDIDREGEIMLDHDYDGIKELDNNLPPWWKYGFYVTIIASVIYMINYHVTKTSPLQEEEYNQEIVAAKKQIEEYMKTNVNNVDETNVKYLDAAADLEAGKQVYTASCVACHGKFGEGGVGPNLTDNYWLHSGGISDIFKSIKYGWVDKGMKSWKEDLTPIQIAQVSSYIKSLIGTNPANPKAPQGDMYTDGAVAPSDSTAADSLKVGLDSVKVVVPADSAKKAK